VNLPLPIPLNILFHVDSGAGQSMCSCPDAFLSLRVCAIEVVGVSGSLPIFGIGTAMFVVRTDADLLIVGLIHECLLIQESPFNLLSVSQFQAADQNSVNFSLGSPSLSAKSSGGYATIPLLLDDGLYSSLAEPIHPSDDRYRSRPRFDLTPRRQQGWTGGPSLCSLETGTFGVALSHPTRMTAGEAPTSSLLASPVVDDFSPANSSSSSTLIFASPLGEWSCRMLAGSTNAQRILAFPISSTSDFDSELRRFCDGFLSPVTSPPARHTYDPANPMHMADLSTRFMGIGDERLRRTIKLNRGLLPTTGRVPVHPFPQGKFRQGKTPRVNKGKVHHLNRASICEAVFTDTFETRDCKFKYGQAFVDYRSRWSDVIPLRSRTQVGWAFGEFCCRNFIPLILIRDNISENIGGDLMKECHLRGVKSAFICPYTPLRGVKIAFICPYTPLRGVKSAFICPYTPQQDQAENYLGRITTMASYAMVYSGAPLFFWKWGVLSAVFVANITATYYSREWIWSTPYTLLFGEPFPDASVVVPFGCGALILDKEDREKFKTRCALLIFIHYATPHPLYTYAFFSPRTKTGTVPPGCHLSRHHIPDA
jgi:hypothetical protein